MRNVLLACALCLAFLSPINYYPEEIIFVNSEVVGPYKRYQDDVDVVFTCEYYGYNYATLTESISYINAVTNKVHYKINYESHTVCDGDTYTFSFPMRLRNNFNDYGARISITISSDNRVLFNDEGYVKPVAKNSSEQVISSSNYRFTTEGLSFYVKDSEIISLNDDIIFDLNKMNLDHEYYYKLDLSKLSFSYNNNKIPYKEAYLTFNDYNQIFKYLDHDQNNLVKIPLSLSVWNKKVSMSLKGPYYVNPISFDIATQELEGFTYSPYFLLPKNMKDQFDTSNFTLHLAGLGNAGFNLKCTLNYTCDKTLIGPCMTSDYCVIGDYF